MDAQLGSTKSYSNKRISKTPTWSGNFEIHVFDVGQVWFLNPWILLLYEREIPN